MLNLLRAEILQMRYRKRVLVTLLLGLVAGLALPLNFVGKMMPYTAMDWEKAQLEQQVCLTHPMRAKDEFDCAVEHFLPEKAPLTQVVQDDLTSMMFLLILVVLGVVIFYTASDFTSGAITTQLTFTPQRSALLFVRTVTGALLGAALNSVVLIAAMSVTLVWYVAGNGFDTINEAPGLLKLLLSSLFLGAMLGAVAALFVFLFGGSLAAIGAVCATLLLIVFSMWLSVSVPTMPTSMAHLSPAYQAVALLDGGYTRVYYPTPESDPVMSFVITRGESLMYFSVAVVLLWLITAFLFNRRDLKH